jgi:hypothetical protein
MPSDQKNYEGYYALTGAVVKIAISTDGTLSLSNLFTPESGSQRFTYAGDGKFYYSDGSTYVSFVDGSNGNTYLNVASYAMLPNIGQIASAGFQAQKIADNPISQKVKAAWEKRDNKKYYIINEKYSSQMYSIGSPSLTISLLKELKGYCLNAAIVDKNTAKADLQIPGMYGRDLNDYTFFTNSEIEYLKTSASILIPESAIKSLSTKASFTCTIGKDGYAKYYKISKKSENKKIKVTLPKKSSFTVYNADDICVFNSLVAQQSTVTLLPGETIVFVGSADAKFTVRYVK